MARRNARVDRLTLERRVGRLVVLRFAGTTVPGYVRRVLREGGAAGAILFRDNVTDRAQLRRLTTALRRAGGPGTLVCVDQEGGPVRILPGAPPVRSAPAQAAAGRERRDASAAARALRRAGVNVALAPVADVPSVSDAALAGRAFGRAPRAVAESVADAVAGYDGSGVAATAKHFPGLGGTRVNTDAAPATVRRSAAAIERVDLLPFRAAIAAGVPLVMVGHARYPALDAQRIASQSRPVIGGLLRRRLGFRGVVVTDSLEARAVLARTPVDAAALRSIRAGADLALTTGRGSWIRVYRRLLARARGSAAFRTRVRESAARVLALQRSLAASRLR